MCRVLWQNTSSFTKPPQEKLWRQKFFVANKVRFWLSISGRGWVCVFGQCLWRQLWFLRYAFRNKWITSYEFHVLGFDGCEIVTVKISLYYPRKLKLRKIVCVCCIPYKIFKMGVLQILCAPHVLTSNQLMTLTSRPVFCITVVRNRND